jgi:hypothetical protein
MDPQLEKEIERLRRSKVKELQVRYRELFGEDSPSSNRAHLFRRIAWRLQARGAGELSDRAQQRVIELADDAELRRRAPRSFWRAVEERDAAGTHRDPRLPEAGSRLRARIGNEPSKYGSWRPALNTTERSILR